MKTCVRVLVADREARFTGMVSLLCQTLGARVTTVKNARQVFRSVKSPAALLLVLDLSEQRFDVPNVWHYLQSKRQTSKTALVCTMNKSEATEQMHIARQLGAKAVIIKDRASLYDCYELLRVLLASLTSKAEESNDQRQFDGSVIKSLTTRATGLTDGNKQGLRWALP